MPLPPRLLFLSRSRRCLALRYVVVDGHACAGFSVSGRCADFFFARVLGSLPPPSAVALREAWCKSATPSHDHPRTDPSMSREAILSAVLGSTVFDSPGNTRHSRSMFGVLVSRETYMKFGFSCRKSLENITIFIA